METSLLTITIPTVKGREEWLRDTLESIFKNPLPKEVDIWVSGNGTGEKTLEVCESFNVNFILRPNKLSASHHQEEILKELKASKTKFFWMIGDDDLVFGDSMINILNILKSINPDYVFGACNFFHSSDITNSWNPDPPFNPGLKIGRRNISDSVKGTLRYGSFVMKTTLISIEEYQMFRGTFHEIFGMVWSNMDVNKASAFIIASPIISLRQDKKEWGHDNLEITLGGMKYLNRVPDEVSIHITPSSRNLALREYLECLSKTQKQNLLLVDRYVETFEHKTIPTILFTSVLPTFLQKKMADKLKSIFR